MGTSANEVIRRIDQRIEALGLTENKASVKSGLSRDAIRSIRRNAKSGRQRGVSTETLQKLAPALETTPEWLMRGVGPESIGMEEDPVPFDPKQLPRTVRLVGYVGAAAEAHFYAVDQENLDEVPAPEGATPSTVAVEIRGTSLGALFDRWLVFYDDVRRPVTADLIGKLCVVGLDDERVLIKKIKRGREGRFTLLSNTEEPIHNAVIEWAARVKTMVPR